ncbi:MAG: type II toxin-antitoxin system RelE/ParE family toxin [Chloroflexi bacterium]|nr:type II toxin-antitoxin system RelE/ParE family toxin [Chloroflexota bacterium]
MAEAVEALEWFQAWGEQPLAGFEASLNAALSLVRDFPAAGAPHMGGTRRVVVSGYPYVIVYRLRGDELLVVAVAHTSRKPGYWRARLSD